MKKRIFMPSKEELAERLRFVRNKTGMSQGEFAESLDITRVCYNRMESPNIDTMPRSSILEKLCLKYNVNYDWLMTGTPPVYNEIPLNQKILQHNNSPELTPETKKIFMETEYSLHPSTIHNATEFISMKSQALLEKDQMDTVSYFFYFQFVNAVLRLVFRMLQDMRFYHLEKQKIPDCFFDTYTEEFLNLLANEKNAINKTSSPPT